MTMTLHDWVALVAYVGLIGLCMRIIWTKFKVKKVEAIRALPDATNCKHDHWRVYQSLGYRECDRCKARRAIFNDIRHQR
jgi:hypothetical protein